MLSGGNDRHVRLWDWRVAARELREDLVENGDGNLVENGDGDLVGDLVGDGDGDAGRTGGLVLSLKHGRKVNWLACGAGTGSVPGAGIPSWRTRPSE